MANGLNVHLSEDDFQKKAPSEQLFMIYKAIEGIDQNGCKFSRERHEKERRVNWKASIIIAAGSLGGVAGSTFAFWKYLLCR